MLIPQNTENIREHTLSLLLELYPEIKISKTIENYQLFSLEPDKNTKIKLYYENAILTDAGFDLFPHNFIKLYDQRLLRFVERDLLFVWLAEGYFPRFANVQ